MHNLNVADYLASTESEGPGKRFALWVQGCIKRCPNCCNPHMLPIVPKDIVDCDTIMNLILHSHKENNIEGITLLGGEPFLQAKGLSWLAKNCKAHGLSVMTFSGYTFIELLTLKLPFTQELLDYTDILIDGPYIDHQRDTSRNWIGSKNQKIFFLSKAYSEGVEYDKLYENKVEIRLNTDGLVSLNGYPFMDFQ